MIFGIFELLGITPEVQSHILKAMKVWEGLPNRANGQIVARLQAIGLPDQTVSTLAPLMEVEVGINQLSSILRSITKRKGEAAEKVKMALAELKHVEKYATHM